MSSVRNEFYRQIEIAAAAAIVYQLLCNEHPVSAHTRIPLRRDTAAAIAATARLVIIGQHSSNLWATYETKSAGTFFRTRCE